MTPMVQELIARMPDLSPEIRRLTEDTSGTQFFECNSLEPLFDARLAAGGHEYAALEMAEGHLPAPASWFDIGQRFSVALFASENPHYAVGVSVYTAGEFAVDLGLPGEFEPTSNFIFSGLISRSGVLSVLPMKDSKHISLTAVRHVVERSVLYAWICIEAMQTPGLTHSVPAKVSRQVRRAAERAGQRIPEYRVVKLGRDASTRTQTGSDEAGNGRALHYRRGHRLKSPRFKKKWRKGCWAGSIENGIILHDYSVIGRAS